MTPDDERQNLAAAIAALRQGNKAEARHLIISLLRQNPGDEQVWSWAFEVADTPEEQIHCLEQILAINPDHSQARRHLAQLRAAPHAKVPSSEDRTRAPGIGDFLLAPLGCLLQVPASYLIVGLLVLGLVGGIIYYNANTDFFGLAGPDFAGLTVSDSRDQITAGDVYWKITYEKTEDSKFAGLVRHASPIRLDQLRILTHDILVTSGEYADPAIVSVSVANHHFLWRSTRVSRPQGSINLLHTVPVDEEIYRKLLQIRPQDEVVISGREILSIQAYDQDGNYLGEWHDTGCNTLLVNSVMIVKD
jgi:hypothetical protein